MLGQRQPAKVLVRSLIRVSNTHFKTFNTILLWLPFPLQLFPCRVGLSEREWLAWYCIVELNENAVLLLTKLSECIWCLYKTILVFLYTQVEKLKLTYIIANRCPVNFLQFCCKPQHLKKFEEIYEQIHKE